MDTIVQVGLGVALCAAAIAFIVYRRKGALHIIRKASQRIVPRKAVVGVLPFNDIVGWFQTQTEIKDSDTLILANAHALNHQVQGKKIILDLKPTEGKSSLLLGVYEESTNTFKHSILIEADALDEKTKEVLGDDSLVVLT